MDHKDHQAAKGSPQMFRGLYEHTIDPKGRTSFPARFRDLLDTADRNDADASDSLIITTGIDRCLVAYPVAAWNAFEAKLAALPQFDPAVVQLKRLYVAGATESQVDRHGRLMIPPVLREYARLERDVIWAGMVTTIELWAKEVWNEQVKELRSDPQAIARALGGLGL